MTKPLDRVQAETWDLCVSHFEEMAIQTVRRVTPAFDRYAVDLLTAALRDEFQNARRSCISDTPIERHDLTDKGREV